MSKTLNQLLFVISTDSKHFIKRLILLLATLIPNFCFGQSDSLWKANEKIAESHCDYGKGNSSFKITLSQLEQVITGNLTQRAFLKLLPKYSCQYKVSFSGDTKTMDFDIPEYEFDYAFINQNNLPTGTVIAITINGNINSHISFLKVGGLTADQYDNLLRSLNQTYLFRGSISTEREKHFVNKAKHLVVILGKNPSGTYWISI